MVSSAGDDGAVRFRTLAIAVVFAANGLGGPGFLARLPERQADLGLSDGGLGLVLVGMSRGRWWPARSPVVSWARSAAGPSRSHP